MPETKNIPTQVINLTEDMERLLLKTPKGDITFQWDDEEGNLLIFVEDYCLDFALRPVGCNCVTLHIQQRE